MSEIEILVRESMGYDGDLRALPSEPLIRRARRRRLVRRVGAGGAMGAVAVAAFAVSASWPQATPQTVIVDPATSPSTPALVQGDATLLKATDRVTTPDGAVIVVSPEELCVGNTHEEPSCLIGVDPTLDNPSSGLGWYTTSPKDFVYAWLTPESTTNATLQIGNTAPNQATLYKVEGRKMLIAVVTGTTCWTDKVKAEQVSTDAAGEINYSHSARGTCAASLPDRNR